MRRFILIAAIALVSVSAQAGDSRSLSTGLGTVAPIDPPTPVSTQQIRVQNDTPAAISPPQTETPRYSVPTSEITPSADAARNITDTPRYAPRPTPVDNAPPTTASTAPPATTPAANTSDTTRPASVARRQPPSDEPAYRPSRSRHAYVDRPYYGGRSYYSGQPYYGRAHWSTGRIIAALHRYGIYW